MPSDSAKELTRADELGAPPEARKVALVTHGDRIITQRQQNEIAYGRSRFHRSILEVHQERARRALAPQPRLGTRVHGGDSLCRLDAAGEEVCKL